MRGISGREGENNATYSVGQLSHGNNNEATSRAGTPPTPQGLAGSQSLPPDQISRRHICMDVFQFGFYCPPAKVGPCSRCANCQESDRPISQNAISSRTTRSQTVTSSSNLVREGGFAAMMASRVSTGASNPCQQTDLLTCLLEPTHPLPAALPSENRRLHNPLSICGRFIGRLWWVESHLLFVRIAVDMKAVGIRSGLLLQPQSHFPIAKKASKQGDH